MVDDGKGGWVCSPDSACQVGTWDKAPRPRGRCSLHGKIRSLACLIEDGAGGLRCKIEEDPQSACQVSTYEKQPRPRGQCSAHGKVRSVVCLVDDGSGGFRCRPEEPCKQVGEPKPQRRGSRRGPGRPRAGPGLPRTRVTEDPVTGQVVEWKKSFGWIRLATPVEHPASAKHDGKVYVSVKDLGVGLGELQTGASVEFKLYSDSSGLGAEGARVHAS